LSSSSDDFEPIETAASVVRIERLPKSRVGLWNVAVTFPSELTEHQDSLNTLGELARRAWRRGQLRGGGVVPNGFIAGRRVANTLGAGVGFVVMVVSHRVHASARRRSET
jgi:hypothetical protein